MTSGATPMRVRFAPSPTGALHIGSIRTALFGWLCAHSTGGQFILRIEDTDQERYVPGSEAIIVESLEWLGLTWDEGPQVGGPHKPYVQSRRLQIYRDHAEKLATLGAAYWCTCTPERLQAMREAQKAAHQPPRYDRRCLSRQEEVAAERASGMPAVLRQRMPEGKSVWVDVVRGEVSFDNADIDDSVLLKSDGYPTYHLAATVDDHLMEITHVLRAEEWLPSTPKHLSLYAAFGWEPPRFAHVPLVLGPDKLKLSKRRGAPSVLEYGELGYLPEAVVNAMALLGWSSGTEEEVFNLEELVSVFSLERVHPAPAVFDPKRLDALNGLHIRRCETERLVDLLEYHLPGTSKDTRRALIPMMRERMVTLRDATALASPLLGEVYRSADVPFPPKKITAPVAVALIDATIDRIEKGALDDTEKLRLELDTLLQAAGSTARDGFRVLYIAILGKAQGVPVFDAMKFIGAEESVRRLRSARDRLQ